MSDHDVIAPEPTAANFNGKAIEIRPLKVGQLPGFARAIKPIGGAIEAMATGRAALDFAGILAIVADHGEAVVDAVSIATGVPKAELNDATPDQLIELVVVVLKVNADFFKGRLTPAILAAVNRVVPATESPGAGPTA
jgi:hypothetical protein